MQALHQAYLNNLAAANRLIKPGFRPGMPGDEMIAAIRSNAEELFRLHRENDAILNRILFSRTAEELTDGEAAALGELADALFNYNRSPDVGIAYRIHQLLYAYAERQNDLDGMVRELYYQGISLFYLNVRDPSIRINLFADRIGEYFRAGAAYYAQYEQLQNPETRGYIIRCMGNIKYGLHLEQLTGTPEEIRPIWEGYLAVFEKTMSIVQNPRYRAMDPRIPWDGFCYAMHYDRTQFLSALRIRPDDAMAAAVLRSAEYVYRHQEQIAAAGEKSVGARTQYVYNAARYHAGQIGLGELLQALYDLCETSDPEDFSGDGIWSNLGAPEYLDTYARYLPANERKIWKVRQELLEERRLDYLYRLPVDENAGHVSNLLQLTAPHASEADDRFSDRVLHHILACHPPTFVHSEVVACLARWFCNRFAETSPALLDGLFGIQTPLQTPGGLSELLEQAYRAGLYHDAGKSMLLIYVGQYSRRLLDEEFACLKLHPDFGSILLQNLGLADHALVARYHHRSYDQLSGYPGLTAECPARARLMVDIVTVVDSLDAGTDNVGRSYAAAKTFDALVGELRAGSGTRYSPAVVALLDDADFYEATRQYLAESRRTAYLHAYCNQP